MQLEAIKGKALKMLLHTHISPINQLKKPVGALAINRMFAAIARLSGLTVKILVRLDAPSLATRRALVATYAPKVVTDTPIIAIYPPIGNKNGMASTPETKFITTFAPTIAIYPPSIAIYPPSVATYPPSFFIFSSKNVSFSA